MSTAVEARQRRPRFNPKPVIDEQSTKVLEKLKAAAVNLFWNGIHSGVVEKVDDKGIWVRIDKGPQGEPITVEVATQDIGHVAHAQDANVNVYVGDPTQPKGSLIIAQELLQIERIRKAVRSGETVPGFVVGPVKGGFRIALFAINRDEAEAGEGIRAFLPMSLTQLTTRHALDIGANVAAEFVVREFSPKAGGVIVSRREILRKAQRETQKVYWETAKVGDVVEGVVRSRVPYGVFVDMEGLVGLVHISDIAWEKPNVALHALEVGDPIRAQILELDLEVQRLKLGMKQLVPNPWAFAQEKLAVGMDVPGVVVAIADFGVFVRLLDSVEGLIHTSEISWQRVKHPSQHFKIGQELTARVLSFDHAAHRISLSTKALEKNPMESLSEKFPVGAVLKTQIVGIRDFGVFVALDGNVTGMVHIGELSWTKHVEHPNELFSEGQEVEVVVLGYDLMRQRVSCSIKRLTTDPWKRLRQVYARGTRHEVVVSKVTNMGAECELEPDVVALCPARELIAEGNKRPQDVVKPGQKLDVEVLQCDPEHQRITLSVRARESHETKEAYRDYMQKQSQEGATHLTLKDMLEKGSQKNRHG